MQISTWPLVAAVFNLEVAEGLRPGPMISARDARRMAGRALRQLKRLLVQQGVDAATVDAYFRLQDDGLARRHENLAALLPPPARVRDEADPAPLRSLRQAR